MKQDVEYKKKEMLLNAAKKEFLEKGYNKASLRNICAQAGVTTGALYFFFENKAELFAAIVDRPVNGLKELITEHFKEDSEYMA
nr:TetR/AcrR family transcriptional regulator [Lachnospiraceae bacterium]